jgi:hypothetical protein
VANWRPCGWSALQRKLHESHDDFRPGTEYIQKWKYVTDKNGTAPY